MIYIKQYRFDYLLYKTGDDIGFKIILYVETFDVDKNNKKSYDPIPENINSKKEFTKKTNDVFSKVCKEILNNEINTNSLTYNNNITAKNFILKKFKKENEPNSMSYFNIIRKFCKVDSELFLLKAMIPFDNVGYLMNESDQHINYILKALNWKLVYSKMPSVVERAEKEGIVLDPKSKKTDSKVLKDFFKKTFLPSELQLGIKVDEKSIENFLKKKTNRVSYTKDDLKGIPDQIVKIINSYGNVLANIGKKQTDIYKKYKDYSSMK